MQKRAYIVKTLLTNILMLTLFVPGIPGQNLSQAELPALNSPATNQAEGLSLSSNTDQSVVDFSGENLMFIENVGQFADGARFQVRGGDYTIWLAKDAIWMTLLEPTHMSDLDEHPVRRMRPENQPRKGVNIRLTFVDAIPNPILEPLNRLETMVSYFIGSDPEGWRPEVPV